MNPAAIMRLMNAKMQFADSHPKFMAFLQSVFSRQPEEGTLVEFVVTRPGEEPVRANIKLKRSDLELLAELKELMQ